MSKVLKSPAALFFGMTAGILTGLFLKPLIPFLSVFSNLYLALLQMCALPIVACTVCINVSSVFSSRLGGIMGKWAVYSLFLLTFSAAIGISTSLLLSEYITPNTATKVLLARMQNSEEESIANNFIRLEFYGTNVTSTDVEGVKAIDFFLQAVPTNIFNALANGKTLQVILFCFVLGMMITKISHKKSYAIINALDGLYCALCQFINRLLSILPIALFAMLAVQFSSKEMLGILPPLLHLIIVISVTMLCLIAVTFIIIQCSLRCSLIQHWKAVKRTLLISLCTQSSLALIPVAIEDCPKELDLDYKVVSTVLPVGITMCQGGVVASAAIAAVFSAVIYGVPIDNGIIATILIGSIFFSIAIIGTPGIIAASMLSIILDPIGIPSDIIILVYIAIIPIIDPIAVFAGAYSNFAVMGIIAQENKQTVE